MQQKYYPLVTKLLHIKINIMRKKIKIVVSNKQMQNDEIESTKQNLTEASSFYNLFESQEVFAKKVVANETFTNTLTSSTAFINSLVSKQIRAHDLKTETAFVKELMANKVIMETLSTNEAFIQKLATNEAFIEKLVVDDAFVNNLVADYVQANSGVFRDTFTSKLAANDAFVKNIVASDAFIDKLIATQIDTETLTTQSAFIKALTSNEAFIARLATHEGFLTNLMSNHLVLKKENKKLTYYDKDENGKIIDKHELERDGVIQSSNYQAGVQGWQIKHDGEAEFNDVTIRNKATIKDASIVDVAIKNATIDKDCTFEGKVNMGTESVLELGHISMAKTTSYICQRYKLKPEGRYNGGDDYTTNLVEGLIPELSWVMWEGKKRSCNAVKIVCNYDDEGWNVWSNTTDYDGRANLWIKEGHQENWTDLGEFWSQNDESTCQNPKDLPDCYLLKLVKTHDYTIKFDVPDITLENNKFSQNSLKDECVQAFIKKADGTYERVKNYLCRVDSKVELI